MTAPEPNRCPWCGHDIDCQPGIRGTSLHHRLCCADQLRPVCRQNEGRDVLDRIMREDHEERNAG